MPSNWAVCRLEDITVIGTGATPDTRIDAYYNGNIPWINSSSTKGEYIEIPSSYISEKAISETNCQIYPSGSLIMAMYGEGKTRGQVSELCFDSATNQACAAIVPIDNQMKGFLKAYLKSKYYHIRTLAEGGNQPNLNLSKISQYIIPIPPIDEQVRIIAAIEKWFALIETLETTKDDLQASIVQAKSKILDLAIHGKLVPQDPNDEPAIELLKRINPKFTPCDNAHYENVPEGWCTICVGDLAEYTNGKAFKPSDWERNGLPIIRIQNLNDENCQYNYTSITHEEKYRISHGDLLFAWAASLGVYIWQGNKAWLNQHIFKVDPHPFIDKQYLYYIFEYLVSEFYTRSHGSGMVHITKKEFETTIALLPPLSEQRRIVKSIKSYYTTLDNISANL